MLEIIIDYQFPYEKVGKSYRIIELVQPLSEFMFSRKNIFLSILLSQINGCPYYSQLHGLSESGFTSSHFYQSSYSIRS
jgi:hypothetical protein